MKNQKNDDQFHNLKFIGYCWSQLPPKSYDCTLEDFVQYCKFQLCKLTHTLVQDSVWDSYTSEEIIVEYYAHVFNNSETERSKFEAALDGFNDDIYDWLDKQIEQNKIELEQKAQELEDSLEFIPED